MNSVQKNKKRTLEDALQEALDNTTPEIPGVPDTWKELKYEIPEDEDLYDGWV